jgi:hypothetical protein
VKKKVCLLLILHVRFTFHIALYSYLCCEVLFIIACLKVDVEAVHITFGGSGPAITAHGSLDLKQQIQIQSSA